MCVSVRACALPIPAASLCVCTCVRACVRASAYDGVAARAAGRDARVLRRSAPRCNAARVRGRCVRALQVRELAALTEEQQEQLAEQTRQVHGARVCARGRMCVSACVRVRLCV